MRRGVGPGTLLGCWVVALWLSGCGAAVFRPARTVQASVTGPAAVVTVEVLRVQADGRARVISRWQTGQEVGVRTVQVVPRGEPPCANGAVVSAASVLRIAGEPRWERPVSLVGSGDLAAELPDAVRALQIGSVLEFDLHTPAGNRCARLSLTEEATGGWIPVTTPAFGVRGEADRMGFVAVVRPGLWAGAYRHGIEVGVGQSRAINGRNTILPSGPMVTLGWMTERFWGFPDGGPALSVALGYQTRALMGAPPAGHPRLAHGPRVILRPFTATGSHPSQVPVGGRLGYLSLFELSFGVWMASDARELAASLGVGLSWDRPLTR